MANSSYQPVAPTIRGQNPDTKTPAFKPPPGCCDTHAHIFGPQSRYRYADPRAYTPPDATLADYLRLLNTIGAERGVLVQPSVYATDNTVILDALEAHPSTLRGIVVIADDVGREQLQRMHQLGVRGLRLRSVEDAPRMAARIAEFGWHLQLRIKDGEFSSVEPILKKLPVDIVVDHMGQVPIKDGIQDAGFQTILRLTQTGRCWVKLSAPMRMSKQELPYSDVTPFVHALVKEAPERLVWGMDWPHPQIAGTMPNDGDLVDLLPAWIPDSAVRNRILVDNPARLYGY